MNKTTTDFIRNGNDFLIYTSMSDIVGVLVSFAIQIVLLIGILLFFSLMRTRAGDVYSPKASSSPTNPSSTSKWKTFAWIKEIMFYNVEKDGNLGLDALMYLKFLWFLCVFYGGLTAFSIPLTIFHGLSPLIADSSNPNERNSTIQSDKANVTIVQNPQLDALTMANMSLPPSWFFIYVFLAYLYTFYMFYLLYGMWEEYIQLRKAWFASKEYQSDKHHYIVMLTNLPKSLYSNSSSLVTFMESIKPFRIKRIIHGKNYEELPELIHRHTFYIYKLEKLVNKYLSSTNPLKKRPMIYPNGIMSFFKKHKVDGIQYYKDKLHLLEDKIYETRYCPDEQYENDSSAFIAYESIQEAHQVAQVASNSLKLKENTGRTTVPNIIPCPSQNDIIWRNLGFRRRERRVREYLTFFMVCGIILLWTLLLTGIITITNLDYLSQYRNISKSTFTIILFQYILAPIAFVVLNYTLLPLILRFMTKFQGITSRTKREQTLLYQYFSFQVFQMAYIIAISVIISHIAILYERFDISLILENSEFFFKVSVESFVRASTFYITTIVVSFGGYAIEIVQAIPLLINFITKGFHLTPRERYHYGKAPRFDYMLYYGSIFVTFMVSLVYSIVAPLIVPIAFLLFLVVYFIMKYQMLNVYDTAIESGGTWFRCVFHLSCICAVLFQLLTCCSIVLICVYKTEGTRGIVQSVLVGFLVVFTFLYWTWMGLKFYNRSEYMHLHDFQESSSIGNMTKLDDWNLENSLFNPVIAKPLKQVWVNAIVKKQVSTVYTSLYKDMSDYIQVKGLSPELSVKVRLISRMAVAFRNKKESFTSFDMQERPPELDGSVSDLSPVPDVSLDVTGRELQGQSSSATLPNPPYSCL